MKTRAPVLESNLERLDLFLTAEDGWNGEGSYAPTRATVDLVKSILPVMVANLVSSPYIYPLFEGGINFEWPLVGKSSQWEVSIDFHNSGEVTLHAMDLSYGVEDDSEDFEEVYTSELNPIALQQALIRDLLRVKKASGA